MRTSLLPRTVIAVATLVIGSVALAAVPATAATSSGVTREQVLTAVSQARSVNSFEDYLTSQDHLRAIVRSTCDLKEADNTYFDVQPVEAGRSADGMLIKAYVEIDGVRTDRRQCLVAALAPTDASQTFLGTLTINGTIRVGFEPGDRGKPFAPATSTLSGDVFLSPPVTVSGDPYINEAAFTASGDASQAVRAGLIKKKVADTKTKADRSAAKKKYAKRLAAAKKAYVKALKKAGSNASKTAAAKKAYSARKAVARSKYAYAIADYKLANVRLTQVVKDPFAVSAAFDTFDDSLR